MSLFSSINLANNALRAQQIGLQVTGQNIANANTPGYIREEVVLTPAPTQRVGNLLLGLGVDVTAVIQKIDLFLEQRLRSASSDRAGAEIKEQTYLQLESIIGELSDTDLSTSLNNFFAAINEVLNQPESVPVRNLAVLEGQSLTSDVQRLSNRVLDVREDLDEQVANTVADINRLAETIARLNSRITEAEGGDTIASDAVGLRDQRNSALAELAQITTIRATEQKDGTVNVFIGGNFLVFQSIFREVEASQTADEAGNVTTTLQLKESNAALQIEAGKLAGLIASRDEIMGGFLDRLDAFAATLIFEFNRLYASGQGLKGHGALTSESAVNDADAPLDAAGLAFSPTNGSFRVSVFNKLTSLSQTTDVLVDLNGLDDDVTLTDLAAALDAIDGLSAAVTATGNLTIESDSPEQEFTFANDTSGVLAALGLNTFFTGSTAGDVAVSDVVAEDPALFAASGSGIGEDTDVAVQLAQFIDLPLDSADGATLATLYDRLTGEATQASSVARSVADGFRVFELTLRGQQLGISGVSLDEEAVKLITYQRAFQASARYIATISELLEVLVNL